MNEWIYFSSIFSMDRLCSSLNIYYQSTMVFQCYFSTKSLFLVLCPSFWIIPYSVSVSFLFLSHYSMGWFIATISKEILCALVLERLERHTSQCASWSQDVPSVQSSCLSSTLFQYVLVILFMLQHNFMIWLCTQVQENRKAVFITGKCNCLKKSSFI